MSVLWGGGGGWELCGCVEGGAGLTGLKILIQFLLSLLPYFFIIISLKKKIVHSAIHE